MNLLQPELWKIADTFGTLPNNSLGVISDEMTQWENTHVMGVGTKTSVQFDIIKAYTLGWKWNDPWTEKIWEYRWYRFGHIISTGQYHYGTYKIVMELPDFRGSWPAFWMIDVTGAMGIPPEIDIFEQFRKDSWLTKYKITASYHDGPKYGVSLSKAQRSCKGYKKCHIVFDWLPKCMKWTINSKHVMYIYPEDWLTYPTKPMNLLLGHGIGDWKPQDDKLAPFIVKQLTYQPF